MQPTNQCLNSFFAGVIGKSEAHDVHANGIQQRQTGFALYVLAQPARRANIALHDVPMAVPSICRKRKPGSERT
jgi:hypothetical protein